MKRRQILSTIAREAQRQGRHWQHQREGANHEIWRCGSIELPIPRHAEIGNRMAEMIFKELEGELGKDWWRQ
jgi:predicted aldo/keto reductase-like oxidoreductase